MNDRRTLFRLTTQLRAIQATEISPFGDTIRLDLLIVDLSGGGMMCQVNRPVDTGAMIQVTIPLKDSRTLTISARVKRQGPGPWSGHPTYILGCQFVNVSQADQDALVGFLFGQQAAALRERAERRGAV